MGLEHSVDNTWVNFKVPIILQIFMQSTLAKYRMAQNIKKRVIELALQYTEHSSLAKPY